jgi:hypothetical protein
MSNLAMKCYEPSIYIEEKNIWKLYAITVDYTSTINDPSLLEEKFESKINWKGA